jgi:hypothetical protein
MGVMHFIIPVGHRLSSGFDRLEFRCHLGFGFAIQVGSRSSDLRRGKWSAINLRSIVMARIRRDEYLDTCHGECCGVLSTSLGMSCTQHCLHCSQASIQKPVSRCSTKQVTEPYPRADAALTTETSTWPPPAPPRPPPAPPEPCSSLLRPPGTSSCCSPDLTSVCQGDTVCIDRVEGLMVLVAHWGRTSS